MDVGTIKTRIAEAVATVTPKLNTYAFQPATGTSITPPCFYTGEVDVTYDTTNARGADQLLLSCYLITGASFDEPAQKLLDAYLKGSGAASLKAAIEADSTLGGACFDCQLMSIRGYTEIKFGSGTYWGAELTLRVVGDGG